MGTGPAPGRLVRALRATVLALLVCLLVPSTGSAQGRNLLPPVTVPLPGPVGGLVNGVTGTVTSTVNDTTSALLPGSGSGSGAPVAPAPSLPDIPSVPSVPGVPSVPVPTLPGTGSGGSGSSGSSSDSATPASTSSGTSNSNGGGSGSGSATPSASGGRRSGTSGSAAPRTARQRRLARTPAGRRTLRRERTRQRRRAAAAQQGPLLTRGGSTPAGSRRGAAQAKPPPRHDDGGVTHTIEHVVQVVPGPIKIVLGLLVALVLVLFGRSQVAAVRARRLAGQREQLLRDVGLLQEALLPEIPERLGDLATSVAYRPADGPAAGGDFYDAFLLDGERVAIIVGDVSGHGRAALARTALMRYTLRAYLDAGLEPRRALKVAGRALDDDLGGDFATVVVAVHDPAHATLTYSCAGHPPPIVTGTGAFEPVTALSSPPIGTGLPTGQRQTTLHLPGDAVACFFTDGLVEAKIGGDLVGREKLTELLVALDPPVSADGLIGSVADYADATPDDMAACVVQADAAAARGHVPHRVDEVELNALDLAGDRVERFLAACDVAPDAVATALESVAATVGEFGGALLRVRVDADGARCEVESLPGLGDPLGVAAPEGRLAV